MGSGGADTVANENTGTMTGAVSLWGGNDELKNDGTITGDVSLGSGDDTFTLGAGGIVEGAIDGATGADTLELINSWATFDLSIPSSFALWTASY